VRYPEAELLAASDGGLHLGSEWHAWRLERTSDRFSVWLDGKLILLHALPAPAEGTDFALSATGVELRGLRQGCGSE
jgi:hypothetical protein